MFESLAINIFIVIYKIEKFRNLKINKFALRKMDFDRIKNSPSRFDEVLNGKVVRGPFEEFSNLRRRNRLR